MLGRSISREKLFEIYTKAIKIKRNEANRGEKELKITYVLKLLEIAV